MPFIKRNPIVNLKLKLKLDEVYLGEQNAKERHVKKREDDYHTKLRKTTRCAEKSKKSRLTAQCKLDHSCEFKAKKDKLFGSKQTQSLRLIVTGTHENEESEELWRLRIQRRQWLEQKQRQQLKNERWLQLKREQHHRSELKKMWWMELLSLLNLKMNELFRLKSEEEQLRWEQEERQRQLLDREEQMERWRKQLLLKKETRCDLTAAASAA